VIGQVDNVVELTIEVPGLAEKRPAVVYGDELTVRPTLNPKTYGDELTIRPTLNPQLYTLP